MASGPVNLDMDPGPLPPELLETVVDSEPPPGEFDEKPNVKVNTDINTQREFVESLIFSLYGMDVASENGRPAAFR